MPKVYNWKADRPLLHNLSPIPERREYVPSGTVKPLLAEARQRTPDNYFKSPHIVNLNEKSFNYFLSDKDAVLVMFYEPYEPTCRWSKPHFIEAAHTTVRNKHHYAGVDCTDDEELCAREKVDKVPLFKMYSRGHNIGIIREPTTFKADIMKSYMENVPVFRKEGCPDRRSPFISSHVKEVVDIRRKMSKRNIPECVNKR